MGPPTQNAISQNKGKKFPFYALIPGGIGKNYKDICNFWSKVLLYINPLPKSKLREAAKKVIF